MKLTIQQLRKIATGPTSDSNMQSIIAGLDAYGASAGLDKPHRLAMYLGELAHESGNFRYDHEIWGPTPAQARYDTRTDLGNTAAVDGDGKLYAGRTGMMVTGKSNYAGFRDWCRQQGFSCPDFVATPEAIDTDPWEGLAPIWFWVTHGLNAFADNGDFVGITQKINGGQNGAADRQAAYVRAGLVLLGLSATDVKGFQKVASLKVDGIVGPITLGALFTALVALGKVPLPARPAAFLQPPPMAVNVDRPEDRRQVKRSLIDAGSRTMTAADAQTKILAGLAGMTAIVGAVKQLTADLDGIPPLAWIILAFVAIGTIYAYTHQIALARIEAAITGVNTELPIVRAQPQALAAVAPPDEQIPIQKETAAGDAPAAQIPSPAN